MNKKLLTIQAVIILLPVSVASLWGGTVLLFIIIGDKLDSNTWAIASLFMALIILSFLGLAALWVEITSRILYARSLLNKRVVKVPMDIGATIAVLSVLSLISLLLVPASKDTTGSLGLFAFGAPALLPYFYLLRTSN